jgi:guanylate kinase
MGEKGKAYFFFQREGLEKKMKSSEHQEWIQMIIRPYTATVG